MLDSLEAKRLQFKNLRAFQDRPFFQWRAFRRYFHARLEGFVFLGPALGVFLRHRHDWAGVRIAGNDDLDPLDILEDRTPLDFRGRLILYAIDKEARMNRGVGTKARTRERTIGDNGH